MILTQHSIVLTRFYKCQLYHLVVALTSALNGKFLLMLNLSTMISNHLDLFALIWNYMTLFFHVTLGSCRWLQDPEVPNEVPVHEVPDLCDHPPVHGTGGDGECDSGHHLPRPSDGRLLRLGQRRALSDHHDRCSLHSQRILHLCAGKGSSNFLTCYSISVDF